MLKRDGTGGWIVCPYGTRSGQRARVGGLQETAITLWRCRPGATVFVLFESLWISDSPTGGGVSRDIFSDSWPLKFGDTAMIKLTSQLLTAVMLNSG
jgi:hypothetical protein